LVISLFAKVDLFIDLVVDLDVDFDGDGNGDVAARSSTLIGHVAVAVTVKVSRYITSFGDLGITGRREDGRF